MQESYKQNVLFQSNVWIIQIICVVLLIQCFACLFGALFTFYECYKMYPITFGTPLFSVLYVKTTSLLEQLNVKPFYLQTSFSLKHFLPEHFSWVLTWMRLPADILFLMTLKELIYAFVYFQLSLHWAIVSTGGG